MKTVYSEPEVTLLEIDGDIITESGEDGGEWGEWIPI